MAVLITTPADSLGLSEAEHATLIFNVFVIVQLFNQVACRKAFDEPNIFEGLTSNKIFLGVLSAEAVLQVCSSKTAETVRLLASGSFLAKYW